MGRTVIVTGAAGLLGTHLVAAAPPDVTVHRTWRSTPLRPSSGEHDHRIDLGDAASVLDLCEQLRPALVVHAAYDMNDHDRGIVGASINVARGCAAAGAELIHLSSDVVFDGEHAPYAEDHPLCPVSDYGVAKATAETQVRADVPDVAIVRTSLLCDASPPDPRTEWILEALRDRKEITLFEDEIRNPARADDVAARIWALGAMDRVERSGPWHLVGPESLSRHDIGRRVAAATAHDEDPLTRGRSAGIEPPRPRDLRLVVERPATPMEPNRPFDSIFGPT